MTLFAQIAAIPIRFYRIILSPIIGSNCRFNPTCSAYALEALEKHGAIKGLALTAKRVVKCHPLGGSGIDNVP